MALGERRHLDGIIDDEGRLDEVLLGIFSEDGIYQLALAHGGLHLHVQFLAGGAEFSLVHSTDVHSGVLLDGVEDGKAPVFSSEVHLVLPYLHLRGAVHGHGDFREHLLHEFHHPDVILVGHVDFHAGKLGVVGLVHALVAEVLREFVHSAEAAHDEALEVEFVRNTQIQRNIQRVMMGDEGAGGGSTGDALEDRCLNLEAAGLIEVLAHGGDDLRTLDEGVLHLRIDNEVDIALTVAHFGIGESVVHHSVDFLHDGKHAQRLAEQGKFLGMDAELAGLGDEGVALDSHHVTDVEEFLPHGVVHGLVLARADFVALDVNLDAAGLVLEFSERRCAHYATAHDTPRDAHVREVALLGIIILSYVFGGLVYRIKCCRIRIDAKFT